MSILIFLVVLFVLVLVHELGHFLVAKWVGMRVDEFGIGFPPKAASVKYGETEYSLNSLPIGGFVKIYGENGTDEVSADRSRAFGSKSRLAQAAVLIAGVTMNVLFAWLLFAAVFMVGRPTIVDETTATDAAELTIAGVIEESPAAEAGITPGATVIRVATEDALLETLSPEAFVTFTQAHASEPIEIAYDLRGTEHTVTVTPKTGVIETDPDLAIIGLSLSLVEHIRYSPVDAMREATRTTVTALIAITVGISSLIADAVTLSADLSGVAGPVGIVGMVGEVTDFGLTSLMLFTAVISLNLAIINLLPIPALDGGRLVFVAIESVIRRPLNPVWAGRANFVGFALLILLMIAVTFNDVLKLI